MKRYSVVVGLVVSIVSSLLITAFGQTPTTSNQQNQQTLTIGTVEIPLDIVVRDKKGRPVRDLTRADFEVYEDGVKQQIESFQLVSRDEQRKATTKGGTVEVNAASNPTAPENMSVTALVFDRLRPEARNMAHKAAQAYAQEGMKGDDYAGVFAIDLSLRTIQSYTNNVDLVSKGIDKISTLATSTFTSNTETVRGLAEQNEALQQESDTQAAGATASGPGGSAQGATQGMGATATQMAFNQMQMQMLETFETLERDEQGHTTVNALLSLVNSMRNLPGRKSIVFFSEGIAIPVAVMSQFQSVISAANRANISIYTIDSAGLRLESETAETTKEINSMASRRMQQAARGKDDQSGPMMRNLERNEDLLRLNPDSGLGQLADQTGGFLVRDTNDLSAGLRRIDEDSHVHYMLTYAPRNQDFDGKFRQISVKVTRPGTEIQTRKGYYALNVAGGSPVLDYEVQAMAAAGKVSSNPFNLQSQALSFPETKRPGLVPVLAEVPMSAVSFSTDNEKKTYGTNFSVLVMIKDASNQVIQKASQNYALSGPLDKIQSAKKDSVLFYRELQLPAGHYTVESVAYDAPSGKASVRNTTLDVPVAEQGKLEVSSLVLLKGADKLSMQEMKVDNPFHIGAVIVYPNLGQPLHKSVMKQLAFFFTAWPGAGSTDKLKLLIDVQQGGRSLGQIPAMDLPAADERGRVQYASALPIDNFTPGNYELKITVKDSKTSVTRSAQFAIEP